MREERRREREESRRRREEQARTPEGQRMAAQMAGVDMEPMQKGQDKQTRVLEDIAQTLKDGNKKTDEVVAGINGGPPTGFGETPAEADVKSPNW